MRTNPNPKILYTVNIVGADDFLAERLRVFLRGEKEVRFLFSEEPLIKEVIDCYILPYTKLDLLKERSEAFNLGHSLNPQVICWGSSSNLACAFKAGCADYLKEPWQPEELQLRLERILKRKTYPALPPGLEINTWQVRYQGRQFELSFYEMRLLRFFLQHQTEVLNRAVLAYTLWGKVLKPSSRALDMHVSTLRQKLTVLKLGKIIAVRRQGYQFIPTKQEG